MKLKYFANSERSLLNRREEEDIEIAGRKGKYLKF